MVQGYLLTDAYVYNIGIKTTDIFIIIYEISCMVLFNKLIIIYLMSRSL